MKKRRRLDDVKRLCSGPGKLTQALDITDRHHEMDLCADPRHCFAQNAEASVNVVADTAHRHHALCAFPVALYSSWKPVR